MNPRIQATIAKMAARMLAVQLEFDPRGSTTLSFAYKGWQVLVFRQGRSLRWICEAHKTGSYGVDPIDIPF